MQLTFSALQTSSTFEGPDKRLKPVYYIYIYIYILEWTRALNAL